jgi:hypothetical protein
MTTTAEYVDQRRAAQLCGSSYDRIRRSRQAGAYPNARVRPGDDRQTWEIPVSDLIAVGHYEPPAGLSAREAVLAVVAGEELAETREQLDALRVRYEVQAAELDRANDEIAFLRKLVAGQLKAVA